MLKGRFRKGSRINQFIGRMLKPRQLIMLCLAVIFVVAAFLFCKKLMGYYVEDRKYQEIAAQVPQVDPSEVFDRTQQEQATPFNEPDDEGSAAVEPEVRMPYEVIQGSPDELDSSGILKDYSGLFKQNNQLAGWIRIPGFKKAISYPLMYSGDDTYYLNRDFYGNDSYAGSIFFDSRNDPQTVDRHIILYGHAMKDMSMFGNFKEYPNQAGELSDVRYIYVDTLKYRMEYEIFSAYYADSSENYREIDFHSDAYFVSFARELQNRSIYNFDTQPISSRDRLLTLSTCNDQLFDDGRTVIHARLTRLITYQGGSAGGVTSRFIDDDPESPVTANVYLSKLKLSYILPVAAPEPQDTDTGMNESGQQVINETPQPNETPSAVQEDSNSSNLPSQAPAKIPVEVILDPPFSTTKKEFSGTVPEEIGEVTLEVIPSDPQSKIAVSLNGQITSLAVLPLKFGENRIEIKVTSRDWRFSRQYDLFIIRTPPPGYDEAADPSELSGKEASDGAMD
jgi:sortase B